MGERRGRWEAWAPGQAGVCVACSVLRSRRRNVRKAPLLNRPAQGAAGTHPQAVPRTHESIVRYALSQRRRSLVGVTNCQR